MSRDLACAVVLLCIAVAYYTAATDISRSTLADEVGAHGLPVVYAALLAAVAVLLGAKALLQAWLTRSAVAAAAPSAGAPVSLILRRAAGLLAIGVGYVLVVPYVGYLIAITATLAATALYHGARPSVRLALIAVGGAVTLWLLFDRLLGIGMPAFAAW